MNYVRDIRVAPRVLQTPDEATLNWERIGEVVDELAAHAGPANALMRAGVPKDMEIDAVYWTGPDQANAHLNIMRLPGTARADQDFTEGRVDAHAPPLYWLERFDHAVSEGVEPRSSITSYLFSPLGKWVLRQTNPLFGVSGDVEHVAAAVMRSRSALLPGSVSFNGRRDYMLPHGDPSFERHAWVLADLESGLRARRLEAPVPEYDSLVHTVDD